MIPRVKHFIVYLSASLLLFTYHAPAYAGMVGTASVLESAAAQADRDRVMRALEREQVREILAEHGVALDAVKARVDTLTEAEVSQLASQLETLPAGGQEVVLVLIIAGLIVVILELTGITDIFTGF